jgi:hypothetical protein
LPGPRSERSPSTTSASLRAALTLAVIGVLVIAGYVFRREIVDFLSPPPPPDVTAIHGAVDSAFAGITTQEMSASVVELDGCEVPRDRLVLPSGASAFRANLAITRAVERAGGSILYGVESTDRKKRWLTVTLGVSAGDSLIREVMLVSRVR